MKSGLPFDLKIPVLYVNPPLNPDPALIVEVSRAGGLGIVDEATSGPAAFKVPAEVPHGLRLGLERLRGWQPAAAVKLIVVPLEEGRGISALEAGDLRKVPVPVLVEVGSGRDALAAKEAGAAGLIARGNEGPGWVAETSGLVLLQEILAVCDLPVFLQGGVGLRTASGAVAAGATGVVLDVHLLLMQGARLDGSMKKFLSALGLPATTLLFDACETPLRVYSRVGTKIVRECRKLEDVLTPDGHPAYRKRLSAALGNPLTSPDSDEALLPLSEDIFVAKRFANACESATDVVEQLGRRMAAAGSWPFGEGSRICGDHGTRYPIVQGPMAHVSDNAEFLATVAREGALPFLAMGNMPPPIAKEALALAAEKTGGRFGVGLIGLEVNRKCYEAHIEIMKETPPPFAILAAGGPDLAKRIESGGTACYLHCPAPAMLTEALQSGLRRFVFEGCESGGHIGTFGSLNLWPANLDALEDAASAGLDLGEVSVLFAGGIAGARGAGFVAGMVHDLVEKGLKVGLQMGTAYLATEEAVSTCAITPTYRDLTLSSDRTVIIGRTVNTRARAAGSPMAGRLIEREQERLRAGVPLRERKELYEKDNLGSLRLASKGCAIDPNTATFDCPVFCDLPPEDQLDRGLYLMGQVVSLLNKPGTVAQLHAEIINHGRSVFESRRPAAAARALEIVEALDMEETIEVEHDREPIAVVGIGLRYPGSASPTEFWEQILSGRSGIVEVPTERWGNPDLYYDANPKAPDKSYSKIGGFLQGFSFDPLAYRIPPAVARKMDRTQQLAVVCVAEALRDAGLSSEQLKGKRVGIILGNSMGGETTDNYASRVALPRTIAALEETFAGLEIDPDKKQALLDGFRSRFLEGLPEITEDSLPGELANVISGRVANVFNLEGPNFTVDAACASTMAATMNAVAALHEGRIDFAVTGGVDAAMAPSSFVKFCKIGALSPDGSRPFDEGANGFVMGEGAGILILKRLGDAIRDKDRIYATIIEVGSSSDGRGKGITAPNASGQERAVKACFSGSGIAPSSIGLIEAHGTSTPVGDKTELIVLDKFFRTAGLKPGSVGIGSVKSQIGHLKAAAGSAGMIKAIMGLYHKTLPPTINVKRPSPCIDWESSPLRLVKEARAWKQTNGLPRRAGVSAFGFGGTNFHIIIEEYSPALRIISRPPQSPAPVEYTPPRWPKPAELDTQGEAWVVGASDEQELTAKIEGILKELTPENMPALAALHREVAFEHDVRCGFAAANAKTVQEKMALILQGVNDPSKKAFFPAKGVHLCEGTPVKPVSGVAFLFPGQGSQYPFMLRDLAERFPVVAQTLEEADDVLTSLGLPSVTSSMFPSIGADDGGSGKTDLVRDTQLLQPMILTANTAIFRVLDRFGVRPAACAGHSLGEYAACVAAGVFSFRDALEAVAVRGREMARVSIADPGLMMSIPADARLVEEILAEVDGYVVAANKNSPKQTVISGETAAVKQAGELFKARGLEGILIPVSAAFHSGVVAPAREPFMKTLEQLAVHPPLVPVLSNVTGDFYPVGPAAPGHIRDLLGKQFAAPVEWVKTLRRLHSEGIRIFLECGPKRVLTNLCLDTLPNDVVAMPTNHPKKGGIVQLMETIAALAAEGMAVNFDGAERAQAVVPRVAQPARPELRIVPRERPALPPAPAEPQTAAPHALDALLDAEVRRIASEREFGRFLDMQGEPIRGLIKSGYENFVKTVLPLERTVRQVESEGMNFKPVVVSGTAAGLPSDVRFPFDRETLDDLILGRNFIKKVSAESRRDMLEKNVERLLKGPSGEAELQMVEDVSGVIKLAGFFTDDEIIEQYGLDERLIKAMDVTTRLAVAAGLEALRDAGIPLVRHNRTTSTGHELPDSWALPPDLRRETGVIFASAFPGMASLVDEVTRETAARYGAGAKKRLIEFYTGLVQRIADDRERDRVTRWFTEEFSRMGSVDSDELYTFNRDFLMRVVSMAHAQLAQLIKAQGPNTHVDAACAGTTQAILIARDWIRTGRAKRVIVVAADDVAGETLFPWVGTGFLALGAATTNGSVSEAALPFDDRRHGLILGSAAVGLVLESEDLPKARGMEPIAAVEAGAIANSGFHGTRLDADHISSIMEGMIGQWETQSGISRRELAKKLVFMSHETYSPKRGGSSSAEVRALRSTFGDQAREIPIANTKGFTGHTMGVGVEDVVALRCLQKGLIPPIPNLRQPDPEFADLRLSRGGTHEASYALRLAAGFGSQIIVSLYKVISREENRIADLPAHRNWLRQVTGFSDPVVAVEERTLRVFQRAGAAIPARPAIEAADAAPAVTRTNGAAAVVSSGAGEVRATILALLAEKTGYPAEMLDTGLDLEADLGIDTVKQAEFISEVRETFGIPRIEGLKIAEFPTIEHIIQFVLMQSDQFAGEQATPESGAAAAAPTTEFAEEVREKILQLLANKTGYPADMLDTGLDLEADLGIDTVKQAEFITEVREMFDIPRIEGIKIADFPTISHIISFVIERTKQTAPVAQSATEEKRIDVAPITEADVRLLEARLVSLPELERVPLPAADDVLIAGGPADLVQEMEAALRSVGYRSIVRVKESSIPKEFAEKRIGVINLFPMEDGMSPGKTFELCLSLAQTFEQGPDFLVSAVSEDGAYGFENPTAEGYKAGIVSGATKSFGREYPDACVRMLDLHPDLAPADQASFIVRSLRERFPLETGVASDSRLATIRLIPHVEEIPEPGTRPGDVVLASGGAGGITAACIRRLAEQRPLTFVILDRTSLSRRSEELAAFGPEQWQDEKKHIVEQMKREGSAPTPVMVERELGRLKAEADAFRNIRELKALGSEVILRSLDIRDFEAVDKAIQEAGELCGRIDVVIHAAGIDISRALKSKSIEQIDNVVSVKVDGMLAILEALKRHDLPPRRIVGFGSVAGRFGNLAQIDYSAANDGLAHMLRWADRDMDSKASIIDWAPWSQIGMATRGSVQLTLEQAGIDFVSPPQGIEFLFQEVGRTSTPPEVMAAGRMGPFAPDAFEIPGSPAITDALFAGEQASIECIVPGEYVRAQITLDPSHPLLDHHRIDRAAVLPGVGGMEIMRAAAALIDKRVQTASFEDVRFQSPLKIFKSDPFEAEVEVARIQGSPDGTTRYQARITSWFKDKDGNRRGAARLHHRCRIVVGPVADIAPPRFERWARTVWIPEADIYSVFFHGPAFRFLDHVLLEGDAKGIRFVFRDSIERPSMFSDPIPAAVEAVFQAAAAFGLESRGVMALPVGIERLTIHRTDAVAYDGQLIPSAGVQTTGPDDRTVFRFDGILRDRDGNVIAVLEGIEAVELQRSPSFPHRVFEEVLAVDEVSAELGAASGEAVRETLSEDEIQEHAGKIVPKRADEWLSGRVALKRSVQRLLATVDGAAPAAKQIRIVADESGKPSAELSHRPGQTVADVSLTHSNGLAMAVSAAKGSFNGLGVDIEKVEVRSDSWVGDYFTPEEILAAGQGAERWEALTRIWCLKEAALKALGTGLRFDLRDINVASMDETGRARLEFRNEAAKHLNGNAAGSIEARVEENDGVVLARVVIRKA